MKAINERGVGKPKVLEQFERKVYFDLMGIPSMAFWEFLSHPRFVPYPFSFMSWPALIYTISSLFLTQQ